MMRQTKWRTLVTSILCYPLPQLSQPQHGCHPRGQLTYPTLYNQVVVRAKGHSSAHQSLPVLAYFNYCLVDVQMAWLGVAEVSLTRHQTGLSSLLYFKLVHQHSVKEIASRGTLLYLKGAGNFHVTDPLFDIFDPLGLLYAQCDLMASYLSAEKIGLSPFCSRQG